MSFRVLLRSDCELYFQDLHGAGGRGVYRDESLRVLREVR